MNDMLRKISLYLAGFLVFLSVAAHAVVAPTLLDNELQSAIQTYLDQNHTALQISAVQMSVLLPTQSTPRDYVVGTQYYNDPATPATTGMMMQWGSITKEYTDALIFQLVNQGKLNANDTLMQLLPEEFTQDNSNAWPTAWANVTLTQLMSMTSGIPNSTITPFSSPNAQYTLANLINNAASDQKQSGCLINDGCFPAGTAWYYSNTNYFILGLLIEKLTGLSFTDEINQNILAPFQNAGDETYYYASVYPDNILANMIHGYYSPPGSLEPEDVTNYNMSSAASAGALLGNMDALTKITAALYTTNSIIPSGTLMQSIVQYPTGAPVNNISTQCVFPNQLCYAMGLFVNYVPGVGEIWWYEGNTPGYATIYIWFPNEKTIVAVSQNNGSGDHLQELILNTINPIIRRYLLSQND